MKDRIKRLFRFEGFGDIDKIIGLVFVVIIFIITLYMYFSNVFHV